MVLDVRVREDNGLTKCDDFDWMLGVIYSGCADSVAICSRLTFQNCRGDNFFVSDFKFVFVITDVKLDLAKAFYRIPFSFDVLFCIFYVILVCQIEKLPFSDKSFLQLHWTKKWYTIWRKSWVTKKKLSRGAS